MEVSFVNDEFSSNIDEVIAFARKNGLKYVELRKINDKNIVAAYLVPWLYRSFGRVQSYTLARRSVTKSAPSLLPRQNTTYVRTTSKKLAAFIFLYRGAVGGLGCLALLRLCAALRLVNLPLRVPFCLWQKMKPAKASLL